MLKIIYLLSYKDKDPEKAVEDFRKRILEYEKCYEPLDSEYDKNLSINL